MRRAAGLAGSGLGLILVALTFEAGTLLVPGAALVLIALAAPLSVWLARRPARLGRVLHAERVLEDQPLEATIEIEHGRMGLPGCRISEPLVGAAMTLQIPPGPRAHRRTELRIVARFERRGRRVLGPPRLELADPLGLVRLERLGAGAGQEVLVLPRVQRPRPLHGSLGSWLRSGHRGSPAEPLAATEVDGLRAYRPGTPASRIHWPALARGAGLLERQLHADAGLAPLVVLDARHAGAEELLDQAVRAAASLTVELARRGGCELLLPGERRAASIEADLGAWPTAHARLALVRGGRDSPPPALSQRLGKVFYVAAQRPVGAIGPRVERMHGAVIVLPRELAQGMRGPALFEVAGCLAFMLGSTVRTASPVQERV